MMLIRYSILLLVFLFSGCSGDSPGSTDDRVVFRLDENAGGILEKVNNIYNTVVVSHDLNDLTAEYRAGFVQGKLQKKLIVSGRDNVWNNLYHTKPSHSYPRKITPSPDELKQAENLLRENYFSFLDYLRSSTADSDTAHKLKRLLFRMLGIYHGATLNNPENLDFSGNWLPDSQYFRQEELSVGYETEIPTFMDIYFNNSFRELNDVISLSLNSGMEDRLESCSAFLKRVNGDVLFAHNSWSGFLSQSMVQTISVNGAIVTMNTYPPGTILSNSDFGYNNKGLLFNETTHSMSKSEVSSKGVWLLWRAALSETFASTIDDFFRYISLDNTGTYLNGYMIVDVKNNETAMVEMSYRCFIFYRSTGGAYSVSSKSMDGKACSAQYDETIVKPQYIMGINYPASKQVVDDLQSIDTRPQRKIQFSGLLPATKTVEDAKNVITYTDPMNPLSIFGRWDLGYGETPKPKIVPSGSIDAKVAYTPMVKEFMKLEGKLDLSSDNKGFWMLYGTPHVNGSPFVWSQSSWKWQKLRDVPDRLDGIFTRMNLYLR